MSQLKITGKLTPSFITTKLSPFLDGLAGLQHTIDDIKQVPTSSISISHIDSENSTDDLERESINIAPRASWRETKDALTGLREAIESLPEESETATFRQAKTRLANAYLGLAIHHAELEQEIKSLGEVFVAHKTNILDYQYYRAILKAIDSIETSRFSEDELGQINILLRLE